MTSGHFGTLAKMLATVTTPPELFSANAKVWLLPWPQREGSLIGNVKQSETAGCQCPLYLWQWQVWCVWGWVLLCWAAVTRRASSGDRSAVIQLHTEKLDWHFLLLCYILHAKHSSALSELRRWAWTEVLCFCGQDNGPCLQSFR